MPSFGGSHKKTPHPKAGQGETIRTNKTLKHSLNILFEGNGLGHGREALDGASVAAYEELGEVPQYITVFLYTGAQLLYFYIASDIFKKCTKKGYLARLLDWK